MTKILVADDEPNILLLTEMVFKDMGMTVVTAKNGQEALDKIEIEHPDIVVTDIIMPEKSGFDVCKEVRANPAYSHVPVILLSALGDDFNKITGFDGGADDYVTKPFNVEELKARVNAVLMRYKSRNAEPTDNEKKELDTIVKSVDIEKSPTGVSALDELLYGGFPKGSNILVTGPLGSGKSSFSRQFIREGLVANDASLYICIDDNPKHVKGSFKRDYDMAVSEYEESKQLRFIDAYSCASLSPDGEELYRVSGSLELNKLAGLVADAGIDIGHSVQSKKGGRRVIDSISSLFVQFQLPEALHFINQVARTSLSFGGVTTLFVLEKEALDSTQLHHLSYIMDGIIEWDNTESGKRVRVNSMKWSEYKNQWQLINKK